MLTLRTVWRLPDPAAAAPAAVAGAAADAVLLDLAAAVDAARREARRAAAAPLARAAADAGRGVVVRIAAPRAGRLEGDVDAAVDEAVDAVVLAGTEEPQDLRDADVALRRREMALGIVPGTVRLVAEVDSARGVADLARLLDAVDRTDWVLLRLDALVADLGGTDLSGTDLSATDLGAADLSGTDGGTAGGGAVGDGAAAVFDHACARVAFAAAAAGLPWLLDPTSPDRGAGAAANIDALAARARALGAAGVVIAADAQATLGHRFTPDPRAVDAARAIVAGWETLRAAHPAGAVSATADTALGPRTVDRRSQRAARRLLARADAIAAREAAGGTPD